MPSPFTCPECDAGLRGAERIPAGTKVRCPSCSAVFLMPEPKGVASSQAVRDRPVAPAPPRPTHEGGVDERARRSNRRTRDDEDAEPPRRKSRADDEDVVTEEYVDEETRDDDEKVEDRPRKKRRKSRADDEDVVSEEYVEEEARDDEDNEDRPRKKRRKKKKSQKSGKGLLIGIIAGSVAALAGVGILLWLFVFSGNNADADPWVFVHSDANLVAGGDVASIMNDAIFGPILERAVAQGGNNNPIADLKRETGLEFKELFAQVAVGIQLDLGNGANPLGGLARLGGAKPPPLCLVAKSSKPFDPEKLIKSFKNATPKKRDGKTYYEYPLPAAGVLYVYVPSNRHLVLATVSETQLSTILGATKRKPAISADTISLIRGMSGNTIWLAMPLEGKNRDAVQQMAKQQAAAGLPGSGSLDKAKGFGFSAHLDATVFRISSYVLCNDSSAASQMVKQTEADFAKQKEQLGMLDLFLGKLPNTKQAIKELLDSFKFRADGAMLVASGQITRGTFNGVAQELQAQFANLGAGGFGPGGGGLPVGPGGNPGRGGIGKDGPPQGGPPPRGGGGPRGGGKRRGGGGAAPGG